MTGPSTGVIAYYPGVQHCSRPPARPPARHPARPPPRHLPFPPRRIKLRGQFFVSASLSSAGPVNVHWGVNFSTKASRCRPPAEAGVPTWAMVVWRTKAGARRAAPGSGWTLGGGRWVEFRTAEFLSFHRLVSGPTGGVEGTPHAWVRPRTRCACLYVWEGGAEVQAPSSCSLGFLRRCYSDSATV